MSREDMRERWGSGSSRRNSTLRATLSLRNQLATRTSRSGSDGGMMGLWRAMLRRALEWQPMGTWLLLLVNLGFFVGFGLIGGWAYLLGSGNAETMQPYYDHYGALPMSWTAAGRPLWPGWLSNMFVHTGFWHWAANSFWIWVFGRQYGWWVVPMYLWGGLFTSGVYVAINPYSQVAMVGASAALSALPGGLIAGGRLPVMAVRAWRWRIPGNLLMFLFAASLLLQVWYGETEAQGVHFMGLLAGLCAGLGLRTWVWSAQKKKRGKN